MTRIDHQRERSAGRLRRAVAVLAALLATGCAQGTRTPTAVDGRLDLSQWDFAIDGDVALLGTWEICWGEKVEPGQDCPKGWRPVPVRGLWSEDNAHSPIGAYGVATYRLHIALPPGEDHLSLVVGAPLTAHRLFIDGVDRGGVGVVGKTAATTQTGVRNRVYGVTVDDGRLDLLVQVANFEFRSGGVRRIWYLGRHASIQRGIGLAMLREGMVFAVGVVVGLGYLLLFALGPSERARGYFGLFSLVVGLRAVAASISGFGELMAPWASFALLTRFEYLGTAIAIFAAAGYARTKVANVVPPRTIQGIQLVALALAVITALAPMSVVLATLPLQYVLPVLVMGLLVTGYGYAWLRGVPDVGVTATASVLYLGVVVHDIVRTMRSDLGAPVELYPYAMVLWILAEGAELMRRFYQTFERVESLSDELAEANFELQETESAIVRFVPFDFLRMLGKQSIRDVHAGDRAHSRISVLHCGFEGGWTGPTGRTADRDFDSARDVVAHVEPAIHHHGGFVNEFWGGGFQAVFPDGAASAVAAGLEIVDAVRAFAKKRGENAAARVWIGIDTGPALLGTIGSGERLLRAVVGTPVDTAQRLQDIASQHDVPMLISPETRADLDDMDGYEIREVEDAGFDTPEGRVAVYAVRAARRSDDDPRSGLAD